MANRWAVYKQDALVLNVDMNRALDRRGPTTLKWASKFVQINLNHSKVIT